MQSWQLFLLLALVGCAAPTPLKQDFIDSLSTDADEGRQLFQANGCVRCHGLDGRGETHYSMFLYNGPPDLRDIDAYHRGSDQEDIAETILTGVPGTWMPAYKLSWEERMKIASFVVALQEDRPDTVYESTEGSATESKTSEAPKPADTLPSAPSSEDASNPGQEKDPTEK